MSSDGSRQRADLQVVKERLGYADIATTARYLRTLPDADETALDALSNIRSRSSTIAVTIAAGPLNYVGVNPKVSCKVPHPSK